MVFIAVLAVYMSLFIAGTFTIRSNFYTKVLCHGKRGRKEIALTFDDGPAGERTEKLLRVLKEHDVKATFFCIGKKAYSQREIVVKIHEDGHIIGNHSWTHSLFFPFLSTSAVRQELADFSELFKQMIRDSVVFFRPPFGVVNPNIVRAAERNGYVLTGWSIRSLDTVISNKKRIVRRIKKRLKGGDIILFHDTTQGIDEIVRKFIEYAKTEQYTFVRLDQILTGY
jgi:peptidoglycan/xylan/chitin deacetylase (PgdA/CDA1 family)